jgi:signal transduction histidine kinase
LRFTLHNKKRTMQITAIESPLYPRLSRWSYTGLVAAIWTLPGLAALSFYYLNQVVSAEPISWRFAFASTLPNWYLWAVLTPGIIWVARRFRPEGLRALPRAAAAHLAAMTAALLLHSLGNLYVFTWSGLHEAATTSLYQTHFTVRFHANVIAYLTVVGVFYAFDYYRQLRFRERQAQSLELELTRANLKALKMQLHPHFLFNTLNSVAALVRKNENRTAVRMLVRLSEFLRLALEAKGVQEVTLDQELDFLNRYVEVEKIRFGDRLSLELETNSEVDGAYVPSFLLQPMVENAIHHGIEPQTGEGRIRISASRHGEDLLLRVEDNGPGLRATSSSRKGVGVANTRERLQKMYGENQAFSLRNGDDGGVVVDIRIPFRTTSSFPIDAEETG